MKGLKIERAKPSNSIDIYALLSAAQKEGILPEKPTERELKSYYFSRLLNEIASPGHFFFLAKRGRGYLGYAHGFILPGRWGQSMTMAVIDHVFVVKNRRKLGIGRKLLDEMKKEIENTGIKRIVFSCPLDQVEYWGKARGATAFRSLMEVNL